MSILMVLSFVSVSKSEVAGIQIIVTVVLSSDNEADLAAAEAYVTKTGAVLKITKWGGFNDTLLNEIKLLNPNKVIIVGGPFAIPGTVEDELNIIGITNVVRVWGETRVETAIEISKLPEFTNVTRVIVVDGRDVAGIQEARKEAKAQGLPIIFVWHHSVPTVVKEFIRGKTAHLKISPEMNETKIKSQIKENAARLNSTKPDFAARAQFAINNAKAAIADAEVAIAQAKERNLTIHEATVLLNESKRHLSEAEKAFNEGKFGKAFGLANSATHLAKNAARYCTNAIYVKAIKKAKKPLDITKANKTYRPPKPPRK